MLTNHFSLRRRLFFIAWFAALAAIPVHYSLKWWARSHALFKLHEPHIDFFLFHDSKSTYLNVFFLAVAGLLFFITAPGWPRVDLAWEKYRAPITKYLPFGFLVVAAALALPVYQNTALTLDEYAAVFQAKVFAHGEWAGKIPAGLLKWAIPPSWENYFFTVTPEGRVLETYLPGYSLLMAPFMKLGLGWLFNPALGALMVGLLIRLAKRLWNEDAALWVGLLAISSPVIWINSLSFYSLNCRLFFNLLFLFFILPPESGMTWRRAALAGLAGGMASFSHNPFPHAVFALPWLVHFIYRKETRRFVWPLLLGYLPFVGAVCGWWFLIHKFQTATAATPSRGGFTYAWDLTSAAMLPALERRTFVLWSISLCKLLLWTTPAIWYFFFAAAAKKGSFAKLSVASFLLTFLAYNLASNRVAQGFGWGHRYSYAALGAVFLSGAYWLSLEENRRPFRLTALLLVLAGLGVMLPLRALQTQGFISSQINKLACLPENVPQVCLLAPSPEYYMGDRVQNDPFLRNPRLIFQSRGKENDLAMLKEFFPNYVLNKWDGKNGVWTPTGGGKNGVWTPRDSK